MARDIEPISVANAVTLAKVSVDAIPTLCVRGEVSGFSGPHAGSGHCYFKIKDDESSMDCIVWRWVYEKSDVELRDGLEVQLTGKFDVYETRASLSFKVTKLEVSGEGALRQKVAALAKKLEAEGLMDDSRKRPIPRFCSRVAVVTSLSGAVIDDVKRTLARRNPLVELTVVGCAVQGETAAPTIIRALSAAAATQPDCILLVRGGGSFEDLMCFNDEALVRAVAACEVPVVTGIGHEPDTSICDMVADRRASTPTAAAESVAPAIDEIVAQMRDRRVRLVSAMKHVLEASEMEIDAQRQRLSTSALARLSAEKTKLEALGERPCLSNPLAPIMSRRDSLMLTEERLTDAMPRYVRTTSKNLNALEARFNSYGKRLLSPFEATLQAAESALTALSPMRVLERGYAIVTDSRGHVVSNANNLNVGDEVQLRLAHGGATATVSSTNND